MHRVNDRLKQAALVGIEPALADELTSQLRQHYTSLRIFLFNSAADCFARFRPESLDFVFCASAGNTYQDVLDETLRASREIPVFVVSRHPETSEWLDALEAGAADYCAAPFE